MKTKKNTIKYEKTRRHRRRPPRPDSRVFSGLRPPFLSTSLRETEVAAESRIRLFKLLHHGLIIVNEIAQFSVCTARPHPGSPSRTSPSPTSLSASPCSARQTIHTGRPLLASVHEQLLIALEVAVDDVAQACTHAPQTQHRGRRCVMEDQLKRPIGHLDERHKSSVECVSICFTHSRTSISTSVFHRPHSKSALR